MSNTNLRYRNGLAKREAVRAVRARMRTDGSLARASENSVVRTLGYRPHFVIDTNIVFTVIEYWGDELRKGLIELCHAQPTLRLYLLDTVASECRGSTEKQALYDAIVYNGHNPEAGVIRPLRSDTTKVGAAMSRILAAWPERYGLPSASDRKDALIAAAAIAYDMTVLTRNRGDFADIASREPALRYLPLDGGMVADLRQGAQLLDRLADAFRPGSSTPR
jgi:hypothetical protein